MYRFFCEPCQRVIRVSRRPENVKNGDSPLIRQRIGTCNFHLTGRRNYNPRQQQSTRNFISRPKASPKPPKPQKQKERRG